MARLAGQKLIVTRSVDDAADWTRALEAEGAEAIVLPCIRSESIDDPALAEQINAALTDADWLVFTSRRGVDATADLLHNLLPPNLQVVTVGAATAARVAERFGRIARVGGGTAAALGRELVELDAIRNGARCVLALAANAPDLVARTLRDAGVSVTRFDVYRTVPAEPVEPRQSLSAFGCNTVLFASPTAVAGFDNQVDVDTAGQFVTIGPSTSAAVRERHWEVAAEAKEPSLSGIIESMLERKSV